MNITAEGLAHMQNELRQTRSESLWLQRALDEQRGLVAKLTAELEAACTFSPSAVRELLEAIERQTKPTYAALTEAVQRVRDSEVKK